MDEKGFQAFKKSRDEALMPAEQEPDGDIQEEEDARNPRPVDPWILELLALAAEKLEAAVDPEPIITIPFVENTDVWARNPNGSIICCRCHGSTMFA
jgi:hypothetical protein